MADEFRKPLIIARRSNHELMEDYYSVPRIAERYGEHPSVVRRWIREGRIKWHLRRISREEVLRFEAENLVFVAPPEEVEKSRAAKEAIRQRYIERRRNPRNCIEEYYDKEAQQAVNDDKSTISTEQEDVMETEDSGFTYDDPDARFDEIVYE